MNKEKNNFEEIEETIDSVNKIPILNIDKKTSNIFKKEKYKFRIKRKFLKRKLDLSIKITDIQPFYISRAICLL
jgi:hypothetical protein